MMMAVYLAAMMRAVVALHNLIENKEARTWADKKAAAKEVAAAAKAESDKKAADAKAKDATEKENTDQPMSE